MGTTVRVLTEHAEEVPSVPGALRRDLSRFRPDSELCRLNADPRQEVPASPLLHAAISAGLLAAELTGGLVDPTLVAQLEANGYDRTRRSSRARARAGPRQRAPERPAAPDPDEPWRRSRSPTTASAARPASGSTRAGPARASPPTCWRRARGPLGVDCGGDLRVGGAHDVEVRAPAHRTPASTPCTSTGRRGRHLGHRHAPLACARRHAAPPLLDPSTGAPAWTGLISVTALAPTALVAEALAKAALLSGPRGAARWLTRYGGLLVTDDGDVHFL